ncbi:permease [Candidatus Omnitrophota bacterium]
MVEQFITTLLHYLKEILPALAIGFFLSGLIHEFVPTDWVRKYLGQTGVKAILISTVTGTLLPICCWGSLPIALSFYKKGARLGPVFAFLIATPATSVSALLVTWRLLGLKFAVFIFFAVILMGVVIGVIANLFKFIPREEKQDSCPECVSKQACCAHKKSFLVHVKSILKFAYVDMVKEIGLETLIGLLLASAVATAVPIGKWIKLHLSGFGGYPFSLIFGLLMYICSTATVPLVDALVKQGLNIGAGMVLLLAGPITSYGTVLVIRKEFGTKILVFYLTSISMLSLLLGITFYLLQ